MDLEGQKSGKKKKRQRLSNSESSDSIVYSTHSMSLVDQRRHSDGQIKLPPIITQKTADDPSLKPRRKKTSSSKSGSKKLSAEGGSDTRRSSKSSNHSRQSSTSSITSTSSEYDGDASSNDAPEVFQATDHHLTEAPVPARLLQTVPEGPETSSLLPKPKITHNPSIQETDNLQSTSEHPDEFFEGSTNSIDFPVACNSLHTSSSSLVNDRQLTSSELFNTPVSATVEEDVTPYQMIDPTQETGAEMYDPKKIKPLPTFGTSYIKEEAEDKELECFSNIVKNTTAFLVQENMERIERTYKKVLRRYRDQCIEMRKEHEAEKRYLVEQIHQEKIRVREGKDTQISMGAKMEELKSEVEGLQNMRKQFEDKKAEVADLKKRLDQADEELGVLRSNMAAKNKKMSELVPTSTEPTQLDKMEKTESYLQTMIALLPDEERVKETLDKAQQRLRLKRPVTTSIISHKTSETL